MSSEADRESSLCSASCCISTILATERSRVRCVWSSKSSSMLRDLGVENDRRWLEPGVGLSRLPIAVSERLEGVISSVGVRSSVNQRPFPLSSRPRPSWFRFLCICLIQATNCDAQLNSRSRSSNWNTLFTARWLGPSKRTCEIIFGSKVWRTLPSAPDNCYSCKVTWIHASHWKKVQLISKDE